MSKDRYFWILAALSAILLATPLRYGDLAGYDDALYAHIAKDILKTGDWLNIRSNGYAALEHPPMLPWMEAALFRIFGISDAAARTPSVLCGYGTILLVYWLARRLLKDSLTAVLAMLSIAGSIYFLKYAAHAMTDVPFTFFFLCAICTWSLAEEDPRWYLATGLATAAASMTRGLMGLSLPVVFLIHMAVSGRRPPLRFVLPGLAIAAAPSAFWYANLIAVHGVWFFRVHSGWLDREVYGSLSPWWRRFTGHFEYTWMIAKSYWPWLPFMLIGLVAVARRRDHRLSLLLIWIAVVFLMCGAARSRVLRYMLPAYPAFAILSAIGIRQVASERQIARTLRVAMPVLAAAVLAVAAFPSTRQRAEVVRPMARAATAATSSGERVMFYDAGQPRFDETNQMQWYGDRYLSILLNRDELTEALKHRKPAVWVIDRQTYAEQIDQRVPNQVVAASGHLICVRLF